jgi:MYXO-CTERM domain-containing protein
MRRAALIAAFVLAAPSLAQANADIIIINGDGAGEGFNDPTPAKPIGGNPGTTLGAQRLNAFKKAASLWGETLDSVVQIRIQATFDPLTCATDSAVLGSASAAGTFKNFANAPLANVNYPSALADRLAGADQSAGQPDIIARFNSALGTANCLPDTGWYLGFDRNAGIQNDLVTVLLHEFGHGLGFATRMHQGGATDAFGSFLFDAATQKRWTAITAAQKSASAISLNGLTFDGPKVKAAVPGKLLYPAQLKVTAPASVAKVYAMAEAVFGPRINSIDLSGSLQVVKDANGETFGCALPLAPLTGKIAVFDRGGTSCLLTDKARNAQAAGAVAAIIINNPADPLPPFFGQRDGTVTIPGVLISQADGMTLKGATGVSAHLGADLTSRAGADAQDRPRMYAPNPIENGSSVSHFDVSATPNLLMEPFINIDLLHEPDLTLPVFRDIGWVADADLDGVPDETDNCPYVANANQAASACAGTDTDKDGVPDAIDNCAAVANPKQTDSNDDGKGDACDDSDGDGVLDGKDNCPLVANANQADANKNGMGDACEDTDGDGILDGLDNCPLVFNPLQEDANHDGVGDACTAGGGGGSDGGMNGGGDEDGGTDTGGGGGGVGGGGGGNGNNPGGMNGAGGCSFASTAAPAPIALGLVLVFSGLAFRRRRSD